MLEAYADQGFQVVGFEVGGKLAWQALPGIAGTFD
jgi:hypothetical protein